VYVSEDLGANWIRLDSVWDDPFVATIPYPGATVEPHVRDITIDPTDPDTIYAALQVGYMLKSTDGGDSWRLLNKGVDCDIHTVVLDPRNPRRVLVATGGSDSRNGRAPGRALYKSEDGGESWDPLAMNIDRNYSVPLTVDPLAPDTMYSAVASGPPGSARRRPGGSETIMIRTRDGGATWDPMELGSDYSRDFPEGIVLDEERPGWVCAGFRGGSFYLSEDGGDSWSLLDLQVPGVINVTLVHA
ncbi:MAG: hypothetical protein QOF51_998, partial [Chloroflexota bacterium]|nr:hypothetical protein [Chloroflexota bacterium]